MDSPFLEEVRAAFKGLLRRGAVKIGWSAYDEQAFGNAEVVLEGQYFLIRLVRDRGDVFADARPVSTSDEWRPLERVLNAVGVASLHVEGLLSVVETARLIKEHIDALSVGLSPGRIAETRRKLEILDAEAAKRVEESWTHSKGDSDEKKQG